MGNVQGPYRKRHGGKKELTGMAERSMEDVKKELVETVERRLICSDDDAWHAMP